MATKPATKPQPAGWGDDGAAKGGGTQPSTEDRVAKLEAEHGQLLEVLDKHGINLPSLPSQD